MAEILPLSEAGRLDLPTDIRKAVGLERGGAVSVWVEDGEIRVGAVRDVMATLQAEATAFFQGTDESVERFLNDRRLEADGDDRRS